MVGHSKTSTTPKWETMQRTMAQSFESGYKEDALDGDGRLADFRSSKISW